MRAAIVLGGGRSTRMGRNKLALERDGVSLLALTCRAATRFAQRVVVAGPAQPHLSVEFALEDPPFGGPVAGIAAGLQALMRGGRGADPQAEPATQVLLLAGDLANADAVVDLLAAAAMGDDGVVLVDEQGWPQFLAGRYRLDSLRLAVDGAGDVRDLSVRRLLGGLDLALVPAPLTVTADLDTPDEAARFGF